LHNSDITFDFTDGDKKVIHNNVTEPWKVTLVDTGPMSKRYTGITFHINNIEY